MKTLIAIKVLLIVLAGFLDFFRGNRWPEGWGGAKKLLLGLVLAYATGLQGWVILLGAVLWALSYANGWGTPLGAALGNHKNMEHGYERWQAFLGKYWPAILKRPSYAMRVRGLIAALYVLPLAFFNPAYLLFLIVLPVAYYEPTEWTDKVVLGKLISWKEYEIMRGLVIGTAAVLVGLYPVG
jgi:hypothetical protein